MKKLVGIAVVASLLVLPNPAPASANTGAILRNVALFGAAAAAALGIVNVDRKKREKAERDEETDRRQASYKAYYFRTTGAYPTPEQIHAWYMKTYGNEPAD